MSSASRVPSRSQPLRPRNSKNDVASDANIRNFAPVARIMKGALPDNAKIAKEAKECMQECVSEFISFITSEGTSTATYRCTLCRMFDHELIVCSLGEMSARETQDCQWRRHSLCYDLSRFRKLCRSTQNLSCQIPRGECLTLLVRGDYMLTDACRRSSLEVNTRDQ